MPSNNRLELTAALREKREAPQLSLPVRPTFKVKE